MFWFIEAELFTLGLHSALQRLRSLQTKEFAHSLPLVWFILFNTHLRCEAASVSSKPSFMLLIPKIWLATIS